MKPVWYNAHVVSNVRPRVVAFTLESLDIHEVYAYARHAWVGTNGASDVFDGEPIAQWFEHIGRITSVDAHAPEWAR